MKTALWTGRSNHIGGLASPGTAAQLLLVVALNMPLSQASVKPEGITPVTYLGFGATWGFTNVFHQMFNK